MPGLFTLILMQRLFALGALLLACSSPTHARSISLLDPSPTRMTLLRDHPRPMAGGSLLEASNGLEPAILSSELLPVSLEGYDGIGPLLARGWAPERLTTDQAQALTSWIAFGGLLLLPADAFDRPVREPWLASLLPEADDRSPNACRRHGLGAVCRAELNGDPTAWHWSGWFRHAPAAHQRLRGPHSSATAAVERALRDRTKRRNPAGPLLLFSVAYAVCAAWLSWRWFRRRGLEDRAWLGILGLTCLFSAGATLAGRVLVGGSREVQIAVLHGAPEATRLRLVGWLARFSADRERWTAELPEGVSHHQDVGVGPPMRRSGNRLDGHSQPGELSVIPYRGERRLQGRMGLRVVTDESGPRVEWSNETGLSFDRLWATGAAPESARPVAAGAGGTIRLSASDGRAFLPPEGWTAEEAAVVDGYLQAESERCHDCAFLAATRTEPGPDGLKLLYLWSVPGARDASEPYHPHRRIFQ